VVAVFVSGTGIGLAGGEVGAWAGKVDALAGFRAGLYGCMTGWADELFELAEAVLCVDGPVCSLPELSLASVHRRSHGSLYQALGQGGLDVDRLRMLLAGQLPMPGDDGPVKLAVDVTPWPRPDAECSPCRLHAYRPCRCDGKRQTVPGWPYSIVAGLEWGAASWTAPLDAVRIAPGDDVTVVTAVQLRRTLAVLAGAGKITSTGPVPLAVGDSGYDMTRLAYLMAGDRVQLLGRVRSDRVFHTGPPPARRNAKPGRPPRHGDRLELKDPATWPTPDECSTAVSARYGNVRVCAWHGMHQKLARRGGWADHDGELPIIPGTLIRLQVDHLPGHRTGPPPVWLWYHAPEGTDFDLDLLWTAFLRRFDLEHTFRFWKQTLGWTRPRVRGTDQADLWTWLIIAAYTQLRLARHLTADLRRPWEKPAQPGTGLTPTRVRRGFRYLRAKTRIVASAPKPSKPGPGRPKGQANIPAPRYPTGKESHKPLTPGQPNRAA
jgi:hypothetical protein